MRPLLHYPFFPEHKDNVSSLDRRQTVSNYNAGSIVHQLFQCIDNQLFRRCIKTRGGFIENQDGSTTDYRPCDGDTLALSSGKRYSTFPYHRIVAWGIFSINS